MPELRIPMDPMNPGQFFACCGLWELLTLRGATVVAHFEVQERRPRRGGFVLRSDGELPLTDAIRELRQATVQALEHD